jgi:hypothetical protein
MYGFHVVSAATGTTTGILSFETQMIHRESFAVAEGGDQSNE